FAYYMGKQKADRNQVQSHNGRDIYWTASAQQKMHGCQWNHWQRAVVSTPYFAQYLLHPLAGRPFNQVAVHIEEGPVQFEVPDVDRLLDNNVRQRIDDRQAGHQQYDAYGKVPNGTALRRRLLKRK